MKIFDGQMIYNGRPRYNLSREVLRTKVMPRGTTKEEAFLIEAENAANDEPANWGPLALAAALAYFAMG